MVVDEKCEIMIPEHLVYHLGEKVGEIKAYLFEEYYEKYIDDEEGYGMEIYRSPGVKWIVKADK